MAGCGEREPFVELALVERERVNETLRSRDPLLRVGVVERVVRAVEEHLEALHRG